MENGNIKLCNIKLFKGEAFKIHLKPFAGGSDIVSS